MINIDKNYISECLIEDNKTLFFTITNTGYIDYTKNMIKSLKSFNIDKKLCIFCIDTFSNDYFKKEGYMTYLINTNLSNFTAIDSPGFDKIGYLKLLIIYKIIKLGLNVLYTDGDIVYFKNPIEEIEKFKNIEGDVWIQNDTIDDKDYANCCTGFMYIRSNNVTMKYFECESKEALEKYKDAGLIIPFDQSYFNKYIKPYINLYLLPLDIFPNGRYFYNYSEQIKDSIVMVHFNWVIGHMKQDKMKQYNMWLLD